MAKQQVRMSREEAIAMLRAGEVWKWNEYRLRYEGFGPNLGPILFQGNIIPGLSRANLSRAYLHGANLSRADLSGANLSRADLSSADLISANLLGANLRDADLREADLTDAKLNGAKLNGAKLGYTSFGLNDLSKTKGLDTLRHEGPSLVDIHTLLLSQGTIPTEFLRGCGMPAGWIEYLPSLIGMVEPIEFYSCFISHSSRDKKFCESLQSALKSAGLRVWYARTHMRGGRRQVDQVKGAISVHDKLLLVLSKQSMCSWWVERELLWALRREQTEQRRILFPISITQRKWIDEWECVDDATGMDVAHEVRRYHIPNFAGWRDPVKFQVAFQELIDDLKVDARPLTETSV